MYRYVCIMENVYAQPLQYTQTDVTRKMGFSEGLRTHPLNSKVFNAILCACFIYGIYFIMYVIYYIYAYHCIILYYIIITFSSALKIRCH